MATFPSTIGIGYGTKVTPDIGKRVLKAEDGSATVIQYQSNTLYDLQIECPFCTDAEKTTIMSFFTTNSLLYWTFAHPGDGYTYQLLFTNEPAIQRVETQGDVRYAITITAVGTRS